MQPGPLNGPAIVVVQKLTGYANLQTTVKCERRGEGAKAAGLLDIA